MHVLVVEDDGLLGDALRAGLRDRGFAVDWVRDGIAADTALRTGEFAAVVLDLGLPRRSGLEVLRQLRARGQVVPVLVLTARDALDDRITGLDAGADDYVVKPVAIAELAARLRALVRRSHGAGSEQLAVGSLAMDASTRRVSYQGRDVELNPREFALLRELMLNSGRVLTREQLEQRLYDADAAVESNAIEVHIHHLRRKLAPDVIRTVRGVGYVLPRAGEGPGTHG
ncbi:MAG: response regulator [Gammaproteobacteria bacterium]|nr:response regulator [Gammaproteobacteria bacterium]